MRSERGSFDEPVGNMTDEYPLAVQRRGCAVVPSICVFDVNETLLDIEFLAPLFQRLFGDRTVLREWFGQLILYSEAITLSGPYTTFFTLGQGVLQMLGSIHDVSIQEEADLPRHEEDVQAEENSCRIAQAVTPGLLTCK